MHKSSIKLYDLVNAKDPKALLPEVEYIVSLICPAFNFRALEQAFSDTVRLFNGHYPGYRESNTKYHDLRHTMDVFLASARLLHGAFVEGVEFSSRTVELVLLGALFHDVGLIQTRDDVEGTGAKHTIGHEQRSVLFMEEYFKRHRAGNKDDIRDCSHMILCTTLRTQIKDIPFQSPEIELGGKILATADLLGQMADRDYLEKLLLLYEEFQEAGLPYDSMYDLLEKTPDFFDMALNRFATVLDGVSEYMGAHFRSRWNLDRDLYKESVLRNLEYLRRVLKMGYDDYMKRLRRGGITKMLSGS